MGFFDDVAQVVDNVTRPALTLVTAPFQLAADVVNGQPIGTSLEDKAKKITGAAFTSVIDPMGFAQTQPVQDLFQDKTISTLTFGYTDNYIGGVKASSGTMRGDEVLQDDWNKAGRFVIQSAVIGAASAVSGGEHTVWGKDTGILGKEAVAKVPALTGQNYLTGLAGSSALARGDVRGIANLAGLPSPIAGLLPSNPATPPATTQPRTPGGSQLPVVSDPWSSAGWPVEVGGSNFNLSTEVLLWGAVAVVGAIIVARRL